MSGDAERSGAGPVNTDVELVAEGIGSLLADRCSQQTVAEAERTGWAGELWDALAGGGYPWISVPEDAGGVGGGVAQACAALETLGRYAAPVPVAETGLLGGWLLARAGLPIPDGPVSTAPGQLAVRQTAGGPVVSGVLARVPWAREAARIVALGRSGDGDGDGWSVVALDPALVRIEPGTNLAGEPRDTVGVEDVTLARDAIAAAPAGVDPDALLRRGALSRAALVAGAAGRVADLTVAYTSERHQFGRPVARFQAVAAHLVQLAEQAESVRMAARVAAANADAAPDAGPGFVDVAAAKAVASEAAGRVAALAHQATGAMGMTREYELGQLTRRLWSWRDEYHGERWWNTRLGGSLAADGADALWPTLAAGAGAPSA